MATYGNGPSSNEIEVSIFGPGYGEAIALHIGNNIWVLIDSCINPYTKTPATLDYLTRIGVPPDAVRSIVASHWHDDHVRGMSKLTKYYNKAELIISGIFNDRENMAFISAYGGAASDIHTGGAQELYKSICVKNKHFFATQRCILLEETIFDRKVRVTAFSPTTNALTQSRLRMSKYLPKNHSDPMIHAPDLSPNIEAIVVHIDLGNDAILLGSDLENDPKMGWEAILTDQWCINTRKASLYKIAHHGSKTGDQKEIWSRLLAPSPHAALTPFIKGRINLPKNADTQRIKGYTNSAYISSNASRKPDMNSTLTKRLSDVCSSLTKVNKGFGAVRFRKKDTDSNWSVEIFGNAQKL